MGQFSKVLYILIVHTAILNLEGVHMSGWPLQFTVPPFCSHTIFKVENCAVPFKDPPR